jgi:hypothetical protein
MAFTTEENENTERERRSNPKRRNLRTKVPTKTRKQLK